MIQTDQHYNRPVVFKMITSNRDKFIQLDTWMCLPPGMIESECVCLGNTHLKPVSFVSNNAGAYWEAD